MIEKICEENFEKTVLKSKKAVVVKVFTASCPKCKKIEPIYKSITISNKHLYDFTEWEVKNRSEILKKYKVMAVPSFLFFKNGILIHRKIGIVHSKTLLKCLSKIEKLNMKEAKSKELQGLIDWSCFKIWE